MKKLMVGLLVMGSFLIAGCSSKDNPNKQQAADQTPTASSKSTSVFDHKTPPKTGNQELDAQVEEISKQYDELTDRANGFAKDPNTFTQDEQLHFMQDEGTTINGMNSIIQQLTGNDQLDSGKQMEVMTFVQNKNTDLLNAISKWPEDMQAKVNQ
ncbi:hypothetical protein [Enterococcus sp. CSURQ0835]|uniref:hypothetical protein n=1 Tax=Enterococcus sp. CSURQ0835 TaxID=2681394 RepID=UPI00135B3F2F|nr:hypothetical protein [Enterococcus sp. CSURQ0835]